MSNCIRCGAYIPIGEKTCPACGHGEPENQSQGAAAQQPYTAGSGDARQEQEPRGQAADNWEPWKVPTVTAERQQSGGSSRADTGDSTAHDRRLSVLSYVGPLFVLPLLLRKNDAFTRFHANQGLCLFVLECLIGILLGDGLLAVAGSLFCLYCLVLGAKNVAAGKMERLPGIGKFDLLK